MAISNGFDTTQVMAALFGRVQWRSLNPGSSYPLNYSLNALRNDLNIQVGVTAGLTAGSTTYTDSSLTGWSYTLFFTGYGPLVPGTDVTINTNGFTLLNTTFINGEKFLLQFKPGTTSVTPTGSGRYYEFFHPLCTLQNLAAVQENPANTVNSSGFLSFISDLEQGIIMTLLNGLFNEPQMIESTLIFDRQMRNDIPYTNYGNFVGYRIYTAPGEYATQITRLSFIANGTATFNIYAFQDMVKTPLFVQSITTSAGQEVYVDLPQWIFRYQQPSSQGGVFYIGYFQDDLNGVLAFDEFVNRWNESLAFGYTAFEAKAIGNTDFVRLQVPYTYRTYGMNLEVQTYKDFTNRIVKNASLFDEAIGLMMACVVLGYESYSTRTNVNERITKEMASIIYGEINNSGISSESNPYIAGLKKQIQREMKRINDNFFKPMGVVTSRPPIWGTGSVQGVFP